MKLDDFKEKSSKIPTTPGVYFFLAKNKEILYIGKATSLRERIRSYFSSDLTETRGKLLVDMVEKASSIDWKQTDSVLEAIILEASLIKNYQPKHNTQEKDDKSFNYVAVTDEEYPRVLVVRGKNLLSFVAETPVRNTFGPFTNGGLLREALKIIRKIFPYRDNCFPYEELDDAGKMKAKPCFNAQIGLCPGVCTGSISRKEYLGIVRHIELFLHGKKQALVRGLEKEMKTLAKKLEFEEAGEIKRTIFALEHINDIALIKEDVRIADAGSLMRIEAYDIAHLSGTHVVGVMTVIENGVLKKSDYRKFKIKGDTRSVVPTKVGSQKNDDVNNLKEVLQRRFTHPEWQFPNVIVVDGAAAQLNALNAVLETLEIKDVVGVAVTKNEAHRPKHIVGDSEFVRVYSRDILLANSEAHRFAIAYHRKLRGRIV
ncbi:MAG: GIY-YIG nuclease family protein [Candidatus Paceibacterota bacterium]|jgi:excinuclease ABC subunit C